ncbi:MAG: protein phosphatase 2C domain-containing protein [Bacillota bacterium]|nr:protein phosphatase 2C domain-containing protein [Bacillota bacterium]
MMNYVSTYYTDIGIKKSTNQDSVLIKKAKTSIGNIAMAVICDGMGGLAKGEVASASVIQMLNEWFNNDLKQMMQNTHFSLSLVSSKIGDLIREKNTRILQYGKENNINLGTTITMLFIYEKEYMFFHVGDSRLYKLSNTIQQLTHDHTLVQKEVNEGKLTKEQAEVDPRKSILLQCVGASKVVTPQIGYGSIENKDLFLLCSDGFRHCISENEIYTSLIQGNNAQELKNSLYQLTNKNMQLGEEDNITSIAVKVFMED